MAKTWPKTGEDRQLDAYWRTRASGTLYTEVKLCEGHWSNIPWCGAARQRRLDGVIVDGAFAGRPRGHRSFVGDLARLAGAACELIEVKAGLSEFVLGQAMVGRWLFEVQVARPRALEIRRNVVLARHIDPAMRWVAQRVGVDVETSIIATKNSLTKSRRRYGLQDARLLRLARWRLAEPRGLVLTRVPLAGPTCGVPEWASAAPVWIDFVHIPSDPAGPGVVVYGPEHRSVLSSAPSLELVFVGRHPIGRGGIGMLAAHALMFERQYGRPFAACWLVCEDSDPAIAMACAELPPRFSLPPVRIFEAGSIER